MIKYILALTLGAILFAASVNAQAYGTISAPNIFGDQTLRYSNGATIQYSAPNIFGDRSIQIHNNGRGW